MLASECYDVARQGTSVSALLLSPHEHQKLEGFLQTPASSCCLGQAISRSWILLGQAAEDDVAFVLSDMQEKATICLPLSQ